MKISNKKFASEDYLNQIAEIYNWYLRGNDLVVTSSGTTGEAKKIHLKREHVLHSAQLSVDFFQLKENSKILLNLPLDKIGGIMLAIRAFVAGATIFPVDPARAFMAELPREETYTFASMVANQVDGNLPYLNQIEKILIGGGPISSDLENRLQAIESKVWHSYASTETISHVALRQIRPNASEVYQGLPGLSFSTAKGGNLVIDAPELGLLQLETKDQVKLLSAHSFIWLGRMDNVVLSGGLKLYPEKLEAKLKLDAPYFLDKEEDSSLGERLIIVIEEGLPIPKLIKDIKSQLKGSERPKAIYVAKQFRYTSNGKLRRKETRNGAEFLQLI